MKPVHFAPNKPVTLALVSLEGKYDPDRENVTYQTTAGQELTLPRPAVVMLNLVEPAPGEEVVIEKHWDGKKHSKAEWTVRLSTNSEKARALAEKDGQEMPEDTRTTQQAPERQESPVAPPTPIRRPSKRAPAAEQPRLFDQKGTGTDGPAPQLAPRSIPLSVAEIGRPAPFWNQPASGKRSGEEKIPANVATREILEFVNADPNTANWSADARQDLVSTILIASFKAGYIGLWERK